MPSKDILSIREFEIENGQDLPELYPRAFALPEFFTTNFLHDSRIVKIFTGENALLQAFYFNYMKLALQSQDSQDYIALLKDKFVSFDLIEEFQLEDKFLSDFQYRKFFKDFIDITKQSPIPDFQQTAKQYPIIDKILQKLFKAVVPIGLFFAQNDQIQTSEFDIAVQIITYLSQEFEQDFFIECPGKCINFPPTDMHLYFENMNQIYLTYVEELQEEDEDKINKFDNSSKSSFVCGEGNSFTSKYESKNNTGKHPFLKADLNPTLQNSNSSSEKQQLRISSSYLSQNQPKTIQEQNDFDEKVSDRKSKLLQRNSNLIRRRSKNSTLKQPKKVSLLGPKSCYHYEEENINGNQSLANSGIKSENQEEDKEKANTLINILDSRVTESNGGLSSLTSSLLQKGSEKFSIITRRNRKKSQTMFQAKQEQQNDHQLKLVTDEQTFLTDSAKQLLKLECEFGMPISLPEPQFKQQKTIKFSQNVQNNPNSCCYTVKNTVVRMEEIIEIGEDQDTENSIQQFCQLQYPNPSMSEITVNLSENVSHKIMIGIIESRNYNISKTSLGHSLTPCKMDPNPSFFEDSESSQDTSLSLSRSLSRNEELQKPIYNKKVTPNIEEKKKSFQEYMKEMKEKIPFTQKPKSHVESILKINQSDQFNSYTKPTLKQHNQSEGSYTNIYQVSPKKPFKKIIDSNIRVQNFLRIETPKKVQPSKQLSIIKESEQKIFDNQVSWTPSGNDEFTKSDILILLDEEYRSKIRAIKNEYKSTIKDQQSSGSHKENMRSGIDDQDIILMKQSKQYKAKNDNQIKNHQINHNNSRISSRSRQTSIYMEER